MDTTNLNSHLTEGALSLTKNPLVKSNRGQKSTYVQSAGGIHLKSHLMCVCSVTLSITNNQYWLREIHKTYVQSADELNLYLIEGANNVHSFNYSQHNQKSVE